MNRVGGKNDTFREHILSEIAIGVYRGGQRLPAERELGERYRVSRNTIRRALSDLETLGILERRPPGRHFCDGGCTRKGGFPPGPRRIRRDVRHCAGSGCESAASAVVQLVPPAFAGKGRRVGAVQRSRRRISGAGLRAGRRGGVRQLHG